MDEANPRSDRELASNSESKKCISIFYQDSQHAVPSDQKDLSHKLRKLIPSILASHDIKNLSTDNLLRVKKSIEKYRSGPSTQEVYEYLNKLPRLRVSHATDSESALEILKNGEIRSGNDVGKLRASGVSEVASGEDHMVFLAIESGQRNRGHYFGEVTFIFSDKVIDQGYFSPFALGYGLQHIDPTALPIERAIEIYRDYLFYGVESYKQLLEFSALQVLWEEKQPWFKEMTGVMERIDQTAVDKLIDQLSQTDEASLARSLTVSGSREIGDRIREIIKASFSRKGSVRDPESMDLCFPLLSAFSRMPNSNGPPSLLIDGSFFWELKVPRTVTLTPNLRAIRVQLQRHPHWSREGEGENQHWVDRSDGETNEPLVKKIEEKLKKLGLSYQRRVEENDFVIEIIK